VEYFLIVNPVAGRTKKLFPKIKAALKRVAFDYQLTSSPGEATEIAKKAWAERIVAVGGDGTINEVASGILKSKKSDKTLGIIPTGNGNDFIRSLKIPANIYDAIEVLLADRRRKVDVGRIGSRYFVNGLGIGLDGAVAQAIHQMKYLKGAYLWAVLKKVLTFKSFPLKIEAPSWKYEGKLLLAGASIGKYHGGNFKLAPDAEIDDGLFDVYMIEDFTLLQRFVKIPMTRSGKHVQLAGVSIKRAPWIWISSVSKMPPAHVDGELIKLDRKFKVEIIKGALEVIA
jgi:YegS/Rv2252/BmrU family lipid kinase